ncbi:MAG: zinc-dependent metalloprotease [Actinomycetaceae bacterium]|nr:zinc-dependent metalloprotease [Actinomycetaceae bacterium]
MSESNAGWNAENNENFEEMLKAVLGEEAAEQIMEHMRESGIDLNDNMVHMFNPGNFGQIVAQVQTMLSSSDEGVNWEIGEQVARDGAAHGGSDVLSAADAERVRTSLQTASLWLDPATDLDPITANVQAWSRGDYVTQCLPAFRALTEPVGENVARAFKEAMSDQFGDMPQELFANLGASTSQMIEAMISSLLGVQYGAGLAELSTVSFGASDSGLLLGDGNTCALVPANIAEFAEGIDDGRDEVELFAATREQAAARLYAQVPWLRPQILDAVATYSRQIEIDMSSIEEQVRSLDFTMNTPQEIDLSEVFDHEVNETQQAMLSQLEHLLSLVEGWVSTVCLDAVIAHLPHAVALSELFQRRNATTSPANRTFGSLVGLELAPRRIREAAAFWRMAGTKLDIEERDKLWTHPDLLPTPEQLSAPETFFDGPSYPVADELEAFLAQVLDEADAQKETDDNSDTAGDGSTQ